ncbi:uncharacterized protein LOC128984305 [Macrosteles quadrilineatus]|uniref:uncharacterized protein LOC128984305 n=1 Tax=Macrosteles quadrilineatus TaxID=74068 RepID=UPI0023E2C07D|nr:uncharacterized protein LOC128984305 [Macrosteles quadrilineatus]
MERKFAAQPEFKDLYSEFMDDYIKSGHMSACEQPLSGECYYLPHHGVFKENPPNSKIRVVFDGSSKTNNGVSLNDILMPGPKLQNDISDVLLYFRCHKFVFTCDIRQMYRQILVAEDDKKYQLIFWRSNPDESLQVLKLNTVTYGLNCSPFIAIRTLQQLVKDEGHSYPKASEILTKSIFYDDIIAGAESLDEALSAQNELKNLLSRGGFELRKWISNAPQLLDQVPIEHKETPVELTENSEAFFSVLGLKWTPESDMLSYKVKDVEISAILTKRRILSTIAKLYDLPGFLTPVIFWAKTLIQYLWTTGLTWDEPVPNDVRTKWHSFLEELPIIQELRIPRYISTSLHTAVQLHGFSDASEKGYAAVVYLRVTDSQENTRLYLIVSKSKVAPLKRISLPRLELCGTHLLGKLLQYSSNILSAHMKIESIYAWCDSTIVLTWIRTLPYRLKVFIANRISELQELVSPHSWNYVKSQDNPADCATRGLSPSQLVTHHLWWNGPEWLQSSPDSWPKPKFTPVIDDDTLEIRPNPLNVLATTEKIKLTDFDILEKYSCFRKLVNVMAYILRFIHNLQANDHRIGRLTCQETSSAKLRIFKLIQNTSFKDDISALKKGSQCSLKLARLSPYIDDSGIVRVGGRLKHSNLTQDAKHPVLLPKSHCAVKLLIMHYHLKHLHAGPQLLQSILSQEVWILSARSVIRSVIFKCQRCFRLKPVNKPPLMGDLPETRLKPVRPFYHTGMDYSGHFDIKVHSTRNTQRLKSYLCLFVCFATKAVHLEIVTDLSVDSFIAALKRFVSRRGLCAHLYSDCGTNYVGASKQLMKTFQNFIKESNTKDALNNFALDHSINFHFQPPAAPHQGGLWESAIKSSKYHLKRVIGDRVLTLMEIITLATQVEAVLNSRPLTALSADPSDISALTPGHFLIGTSLVAVPEPNLEEVPENRLNHWQTVQALHQRFWRRWHQEYLHQLQQRKKWEKPNKNLEVGDLVIIQDPRTPPLLWPLGRIVKTSPGSDGIVRVVTIKTQRGFFLTSIWRHIQGNGIVKLYKSRPDIKLHCGMLYALAFLPVADVPAGMLFLWASAPDLLKTNNFCESWNNRFQHLVGCTNPSFWTVFRAIQEDEALERTSRLLPSELRQRLHNYDDEVRGLFSDFKALFDKVVYDDPGSDYDETEACSMQDEISDLYISLISDLKIVLPAKTKEVTPPTQPSLRLPKFELPKFSGNYEEWVFSKDGQQTVLRAVLDSASQLTLISERAVQLISASRTRAHDEIQGISGSLIHSRGVVHIDISAVNGQRLAYHHPCLVLNRITSPLPQIPVSPQVKGSLNDFVLADPCFDKPGEIDLLIGADLFALSLTGEQHFLGHNLPQVLGTIFGFVVMGIAPVATSELSIPKTVSDKRHLLFDGVNT